MSLKRKQSNGEILSPVKRINNQQSAPLNNDAPKNHDQSIGNNTNAIKPISAAELIQPNTLTEKTTYEEAIKEAIQMTELTPQKASGYLLSSELYASFGYQKQAIQILQRGLDSVQHQNDDEYKKLEVRKSIAEARLEHRVDFIANIPYDVLWKIASYLSGESDTLYECIHVNRSWRSKILGCPGFWQEVSLKGPNVSHILQMMHLASNDIQVLHVNTYQASVKKVFDMMQCKTFGSLRSLTILVSTEEPRKRISQYRTKRPSYEPILVFGQISSILPTVAQTLTKLRLNLHWVSEAPDLMFILSTCRNLYHIEFACGLKNTMVGLASLEHSTLLRSISLSIGASPLSTSRHESFITSTDLERLLQCSPNIQHLYINQVFFDVLEIINRLDLYLRFIAVNSYSGKDHFTSHVEKDATMDLPGRGSSEKRDFGQLRYLDVDGWSSPDNIRMILEKNCNALETLRLSRKYIAARTGRRRGDYRHSQPPDISTLTVPSHNIDMKEITSSTVLSAQFPVLSKLTKIYANGIYPTAKGFWPGLSKISCNSPNMKTLEITDSGCYSLTNNDNVPSNSGSSNNATIINNAINSMTQFGTISSIMLSILNNEWSYARLLESYAVMDPELCHLNELTVLFNTYRLNDNLDKDVMDIIISTATIRSLRKLRWYNHCENVRESEMLKFTKAIGELPFLEQLSLRRRKSFGKNSFDFSDQFIHNLCASKSLKSLDFSGEMFGFNVDKAEQMFLDHLPYSIEFSQSTMPTSPHFPY